MKDPYSMGMFNKKHPDIMKGFFKEGTKALARESATWSELPSEYAFFSLSYHINVL